MSKETHSRAPIPDSVYDRARFARVGIKRLIPTIPGFPYLLISPFFILFAIFLAFPIFYTLYLSFFEYQGIGEGALFWINLGIIEFPVRRLSSLEFIGLGNYSRMLTDSLFHQALFNTFLILFIQVPIWVVSSLGLALILNSAMVRAKGIFRTVIALPVSANYVAYSTIFLLLFNEQIGLINHILGFFSAGPIPWLSEPFWARVTIISTLTWRWTGYLMVIFLAGLQTIPPALYEAAEMDGANRWQKFRYVTLPQLRPIMLFVVVTSTIGIFKLFSEPYIITGGGPVNSTITIVQYIYRQAFVNYNLGYASALTYVLVFLIAAVSIIQIRIGGDN